MNETNETVSSETPTPKTPTYKFDYRSLPVSEIQLEVREPKEMDPGAKAKMSEHGGYLVTHGGKAVTKVLIDGEAFTPTGRFWNSLYSRFQLNNSFFRFFNHEEVFKRISEREPNNKVRIAIERNVDTGDSRLLAATGLNKPVVIYDDLLDILKVFAGDQGSIRYHNGTVVSTHTPRIGGGDFAIAGDKFSNKYELHCPVDGYGTPSVFLAMLRWVCSNGAVGFAPAFQTTLNLGGGGDNTRYAIQRALDAFTNDEGYAMMRGKFESATRSWASVREHQELYKAMLRLQNDPVLMENIGNWRKTNVEDMALSPGNALMKAFDRSLGDPYRVYNADPNIMGAKRQRTLPMPCKVYDMINFATELATHYVSEGAARSLQGWVGKMLTEDFDLEDSADEFQDWRDLFFHSRGDSTPKGVGTAEHSGIVKTKPKVD